MANVLPACRSAGTDDVNVEGLVHLLDAVLQVAHCHSPATAGADARQLNTPLQAEPSHLGGSTGAPAQRLGHQALGHSHGPGAAASADAGLLAHLAALFFMCAVYPAALRAPGCAAAPWFACAAGSVRVERRPGFFRGAPRAARQLRACARTVRLQDSSFAAVLIATAAAAFGGTRGAALAAAWHAQPAAAVARVLDGRAAPAPRGAGAAASQELHAQALLCLSACEALAHAAGPADAARRLRHRPPPRLCAAMLQWLERRRGGGGGGAVAEARCLLRVWHSHSAALLSEPSAGAQWSRLARLAGLELSGHEQRV